MPLFLSLRAAIRSHIAAMTVGNLDDLDKVEGQRETARRYLALAAGCLDPAPPVLVAVGGASGSGKTTVARAIAPGRSEAHTSELQSLMRTSYAVFCLQKKQHTQSKT